jgi:polar amino acid transport system ATP-binding protein
MEDGEIIDRASTGDFFAGHVSERAQRFLTQILH